VALDSCYHLACDGVSNINPAAIEELGSAAVSVVEALAFKEDLASFLQNRKN